MKAPTISRRIWLVASTVAVIGGLFAYYFFVYMEARKVELEAKKFRALAQYAVNIKNAYAERTKKFASVPGSCVPDPLKCIPIDLLKIVHADTIKDLGIKQQKNESGSPECVALRKGEEGTSSHSTKVKI
jgi:hypothetical protein